MPPEAAATPGRKPLLHGPLAALGAGGLQALSFAPGPLPAWSLPFVQVVALAVLAHQVFCAASPLRAAWRGWLFGFALFLVGVYWLTISMHTFGGMPLALAIAALALFAGAMALYAALAAALTRLLCGPRGGVAERAPRQILNAALWASAWTLCEWLRSTLFTGFPWLNIGYAHAEGMFTGWAPIIGVHGLAWLAAFAAGAIALMARAKDTVYDRSAAATIGLAVATGLLGIAWTHIAWVRSDGAPMVVRLVQTGTPQSQKFDAARFQDALAKDLRLAGLPPKSPDDAPGLVVLPETVMPAFQDAIHEDIWARWRAVAQALGAPVLMGMPLRRTTPEGVRVTNGALVIEPDGAAGATPGLAWHYDKRHLVPFGEFVPPGFRWFVDAMDIPLGDFDRGPAHQPPLRAGSQTFAVDICYEDTFGAEIAATVRPGPQGDSPSVLVNLSNLAWFGDTWALRQHLRIARLRALETGRPMIRATNTGMTAAIDPLGRVRATLDTQGPGVLDVEIQGTQGLTPYVRWGDLPTLAWTLACLLLGLARRNAPRRHEATADAGQSDP
ncbi:apolipoprotein N-acyltransferase [Castellaniella sp. GW247-6E4]|uniref:apolipoprotein N-acyltransferase n=1 Tax=Castellaniella sp. GW247-6E4 TaxID=3140380 RepID=UPI0033160754